MKMLLLVLLFPLISLADLTLSPAPVSGEIILDSASKTIYITNSSAVSVSPSLTIDSNAAGISIATNRCPSIKPQGSCYIILLFSSFGRLSSSVSVPLKNNGSPIVSLKYNPLYSSSGQSEINPLHQQADDFLSHSIEITNNTPSTKTYSPTFSGTDASKFSIVLNRCINVPSKGKCSFSFRLKPQPVGSYSATITEPQISVSASIDSLISLSVDGVVSPPNPSLSVSPSSLSFGTLKKFGNSSAKNIIITNTSSLTISPVISLSSKMSLILNRCQSLAPAQSCSISVAMSPPTSDLNGAMSESVSIKPSAL